MDTVITLQEAHFLGLATNSATSSSIAEVLQFPLVEGVAGVGFVAPKKGFVLAEFFPKAGAGLDENASKITRPFDFGRAFDDIRASDLPSAGKRVAYGIRALVQGSAPDLVEEITTTDDGGLTMEYTSARTGREITFLLPPDGRVRYFVASGGGERYAGIVLADDAVGELALWVAQERALPARGLQVGDSSLRRRR